MRAHTEEQLRELAAKGAAELDGATATELLQWTDANFGGVNGLGDSGGSAAHCNYIVASNMADAVLVDLATKVRAGVPVLFLDTGYHFAETLGTRDAVATTYDVTVRTVLPLITVEQQTAEHGPDLWSRDPDACCAIRKVEPLERGLSGYDAWATGMRREDAPTRSDIDVVGWDTRRDKVKLNPLAAWTQADVDRYAEEHGVLLNPLRQLGYASIGCEPCTRPVAAGEDPRSGRWSGTGKTECGLHT